MVLLSNFKSDQVNKFLVQLGSLYTYLAMLQALMRSLLTAVLRHRD